jgi:glyoxylase-like metal-dependent hydrolase (beta-lactamase superfamily II)
MTLEDHVGDIIRKARQATNVSKEAVAQAGGITVAQLAEIEDSGATPAKPDLGAIAHLVGLNGTKLEQIANGWLPKGVDPGRWREVRQIQTAQRLTVNCYLMWDEATREAALFDTGWDAKEVFDLVDQRQLQLKHLFITHSHEDHIAAIGQVRERFPKIRLHSSSKNAPPEQRNRANDFIHLGNLRITNRDTPGHAEDGVTYVIGNFPEDAPNVAVVGDCIFAGSIGRGFISTELLKQKIREQIFSLPEDTLICPGHGPLTTVALEKENNPFF